MIPLLALWACSGGEPGLSVEALRDPGTCQECHPDHYREWSGSMHAYASEDPVFRALNELGQEQTDGELGDLCVQCHAPLAVELGLTTDGLDLDDIDPALLGVNCYFCHQVEAVEGTHNNPLRLAMDTTMRAAIRDPVDNDAHPSAYSPLLDRDQPESSDLCGSCHDIVTPLGAHIERTYTEWQGSLFSDPRFGLDCGSCHMFGREGLAAQADGVKLRDVHDHAMPGVDIALTDWPERDAQREMVQELLDDTVSAYLCVQPPAGSSTLAVVTLENVAAGHFFPSGATSERRVWVDVRAYEQGELVWSSGAVDDGVPLDSVDEPEMWRIHSTKLDANGDKTLFFWDAQDIDYGGLLPVQTTLDPQDPAFVQTHQSKSYVIRGGTPDRVTVAVKVRPVTLELIDLLIAQGRLEPAIRDELPTFTLRPTVIEWTADVPVNNGDFACVPEPPPTITTP